MIDESREAAYSPWNGLQGGKKIQLDGENIHIDGENIHIGHAILVEKSSSVLATI